jgi:hypothetical protein
MKLPQRRLDAHTVVYTDSKRQRDDADPEKVRIRRTVEEIQERKRARLEDPLWDGGE